MKRKQLASLYIAVLCMTAILTILAPKWENAQASQEAAVIPDEAIRLRILANSDSRQDQQIKRAIRDEVNVHITEWVQDLTSIEAAREVIQGHLPDIRRIAEDYVKEQGVAQQVEVEFGKANFPTKLYGEYIYPAGEYEAIVITLGSGQGANWWCVLFPPLCFLDFSNGTAVSMSPMEEEAGQGQGEASAKDMKEQEQRKASTEEKDEQGQEEALVKDMKEQEQEEALAKDIKGQEQEKASAEEEDEQEQGEAAEQGIPEELETAEGEAKGKQTIEVHTEEIEKKILVVELFKDLF